MSRFSSYKLQMLAAALVLVTAGGSLQKQLNRQRQELGLTRVTPLENAPPLLAFTTVALGGFRGLIANILWIRANDLQQEDRFFEQVQLADWITKLQPSFAQVWVVQAWNMAYNISVKFRDPADRWRWVQRGIELLRDEGIRYNPKEALIYRELAWFFQHKIGQTMDDAHVVYKQAWGTNMAAVLGGGRPNYDELFHPTTEEARARLRRLREEYKMDPATMKKADELYGPLEWRLPEASAIYWAVVGLEKSNNKDLTPLRRVIFQCLHTIVLRGRIIHVRDDGRFVYGPDLSKIQVAYDGYEKMLAEEKERPIVVQKAQRNFLKEVVYLLYTRNRIQEADRWMTILKSKYPDAVPADQTVEQFGLKRLTEGVGEMNHNKARVLIDNLLLQHFETLAIDEDEQAAGALRLANRVWENYDRAIQARREPLQLEPFSEMYIQARDRLLDPENGYPPLYLARLRTKLGLPPPPPVAPATNRPPASK
ncbi:MAG TPA: hypothetical protein VNU68_03355 [Verrucomicrobiae bacterium]|nr:hypothetical protein [Verrucomicrobiae bacterium]